MKEQAYELMDWVREVMQGIGFVIEVVGVLIVVGGAAIAIGPYLVRLLRGRVDSDEYGVARQQLGRAILLGLEFLIAADLIDTVALEPTLESVAILGFIVLVRTFLSTSLEMELTGRWPWQAARAEESARPPT